MKMINTKKIYYPFIAAILIMAIGLVSVGISHCRVEKDLNDAKNELESTQNDLESTKNDLIATQNDLMAETEKSDALNKDLEIANMTINDLKGEEYRLMYLGDYTTTHYCCEKYAHICGGGNGITATGTHVTAGRTIAVDPSVIPYGTTVYIEGYGFRVAEDCGGGVNGKHIDIAVDTHANALAMGSGTRGVWILVKN